ncbi:MAG: GNAT family N-acetyltransferase, partial [Methyloligellaceae bacterium]
ILVSFARGDHLHVENVAVSAAAQGRGVGRALMDRAEEQARNLGLNAVELYTNEVMEENFPFYAALGYVITGRAVEDGYKRVYFRKELGD